MNDAAAVFVHGLFSSSETWEPIVHLLRETDEIVDNYDFIQFGYSSPKWNFNPSRRIPDFGLIAASLKTFMETDCETYRTIVFIAHSQGGLIVQRYLTLMLDEGRGKDLARISRVILLACPNNGSEFLRVLRNSISTFWMHPQERQLRPYADSVADTHWRVMNRIVNARSITSDSCPIEFHVYAGESDNIVTPASARSTFPNWGALPGDHNSILHADSLDNRTYKTLKTNLLQVIRGPSQPASLPPPEHSIASLSPEGNLEYQAPLISTSKTTTPGSGPSETEIFDPDPAEQYLHQDEPRGEEADIDG